ncbi:MAG TPA: hypothetical protein VNW52_13010 [Burkholderiaceae bacterium]|jgi:hypothetical protein|nr:hypothetical protein [Burkholderiaceae bacterium]
MQTIAFLKFYTAYSMDKASADKKSDGTAVEQSSINLDRQRDSVTSTAVIRNDFLAAGLIKSTAEA